MTGRDDDRTWAELVESFHASPNAAPSDESRRWPEAEDIDPDAADDHDQPSVTLGGYSEFPDASAHAGLMPAGPAGRDAEEEVGGRVSGESDDQADHFVPPPPPPLPRGDRVSRAAWWAVLGSPALFIVIVLLQKTPPDWMVIGLIGAFVAGFATLVSRLSGHHPDDPDNGAVV